MMSIKLYNCSCIRVGYDCHWEVRARIGMISLVHPRVKHSNQISNDRYRVD